jgi:uncharacterized membrane protein (UPF0127 family)
MGQLYQLWNIDRGVSVATRVRLARNSFERRKGLLSVSELDCEAGLLIDPSEAIHTFGMKMPIDVLFLDRKHRVRKIALGLAPNRVCFCFAAASVVELAAGAIARSGTQVNDRLGWQLQ